MGGAVSVATTGSPSMGPSGEGAAGAPAPAIPPAGAAASWLGAAACLPQAPVLIASVARTRIRVLDSIFTFSSNVRGARPLLSRCAHGMPVASRAATERRNAHAAVPSSRTAHSRSAKHREICKVSKRILHVRNSISRASARHPCDATPEQVAHLPVPVCVPMWNLWRDAVPIVRCVA